MNATALVLHGFGYPASIAVIIRFVPVVRERRVRWFVVHQIAVAAIVAGWALKSQWMSVAINATWLVIAQVWYSWGAGKSAQRAEHGVD